MNGMRSILIRFIQSCWVSWYAGERDRDDYAPHAVVSSSVAKPGPRLPSDQERTHHTRLAMEKVYKLAEIVEDDRGVMFLGVTLKIWRCL